ncbi:MAG: DUF1540 domain-containing protein [Sporomusaceae bacterium]|jgi:hypothetical protein|nr:DUF1540 domain-containing protein [Sporomusaceae bacterium]
MSNPTVKCSVNECAHYTTGERCLAAKVSVYHTGTKEAAETLHDTECRSFQERKGIGDMLEALANTNIGGAVSSAFISGAPITPSVECFVSNCKNWSAGYSCQAPNIELTGRNAAAKSNTDCQMFALS